MPLREEAVSCQDFYGKKLGGNDAGVMSLLAFPYPGCDGFER
jgi:hypothetical protein